MRWLQVFIWVLMLGADLIGLYSIYVQWSRK
jgi:hypothetical protein